MRREGWDEGPDPEGLIGYGKESGFYPAHHGQDSRVLSRGHHNLIYIV